MVRFGPLLRLVPLACLISVAFAQGGAGGYGQGGPGGGGFGGRGGFEPNAPYDKKSKPDEDDTPGLWQSKTAVLTPGDRYEIKLKVQKGETLLASATSDAFDPALSVEDLKGVVLTKNDDRVEGDQSPFVVYRFTEEGTYTLKVLSYHSVSGGQFNVKMRTFLSTDAGLGAVTHDNVDPGKEYQGYSHVIFRLPAQKNKIYDLRNVVGLKPNQVYGCRLLRIVGPTGVDASDFETIPTSDSTPVFLALADGDYYFEYSTSKANQFKTDYREATVVTATPPSDLKLNLEPGELKVVEFQIKPDQIVRSTVEGTLLAFDLSAPAAQVPTGGQSSDESFGNNPYWLWFKMNRDSDADVVRVFHGSGKARFTIRSNSPTTQTATFKNTESVPVWPIGDPVKSTIEIGDSRLYLVKSTKSELMRVLASASHFQPRLDIFRLNGELANVLINRKTHTAGDDLYFPDEGTFLVRMSCDGHGGSGDFVMKRDSLNPAPYALGAAQTLNLDGANFGLYSVNLEAGKRYQLMTDEPGKYLRADLLDDDGQFLVSQAIRFDKVVVQYFVPTRSGRHRLWLRGAPGLRHFKFELHIPPSIGG